MSGTSWNGHQKAKSPSQVDFTDILIDFLTVGVRRYLWMPWSIQGVDKPPPKLSFTFKRLFLRLSLDFWFWLQLVQAGREQQNFPYIVFSCNTGGFIPQLCCLHLMDAEHKPPVGKSHISVYLFLVNLVSASRFVGNRSIECLWGVRVMQVRIFWLYFWISSLLIPFYLPNWGFLHIISSSLALTTRRALSACIASDRMLSTLAGYFFTESICLSFFFFFQTPLILFTTWNAVTLLGLLIFMPELVGRHGYLSWLNTHIKINWSGNFAIC